MVFKAGDWVHRPGNHVLYKVIGPCKHLGDSFMLVQRHDDDMIGETRTDGWLPAKAPETAMESFSSEYDEAMAGQDIMDGLK